MFNNKIVILPGDNPIKALSKAAKLQKQLFRNEIKDTEENYSMAQTVLDSLTAIKSKLLEKLKNYQKTDIDLEAVSEVILDKKHSGIIRALLDGTNIGFNPDFKALVFFTEENAKKDPYDEPVYYYSLDFKKEKIVFCYNVSSEFRIDEISTKVLSETNVIALEHLEEILLQNKNVGDDILLALYLISHYAKNKKNLQFKEKLFLNGVGSVIHTLNNVVKYRTYLNRESLTKAK